MMKYTEIYKSPIGEILIACDKIGLTGLWFKDEKFNALNFENEYKEKTTYVLEKTKCWLDIYFSGKEPDFMPDIHLIGSPFQIYVWKILKKIPYGEITTYGEIAKEIAQKRGIAKMSAQAVGGAVSRNKISIIMPCHRVIDSKGSLRGYSGGIEKKLWLLNNEGLNIK